MSRRHWFPKPYADAVMRLRVPSGFLLLGVFALLAEPTWRSLLLGVPYAVAGLWLRGWAAGHLRKNQVLTTSGPYGRLRNPLYLGTLLVAIGVATAAQSLAFWAIVAIVFALVYLPVIEQEEQHLRKLFPDFAAYEQRVPLLLPFGPGGLNTEPFSWRVYRHNQEYQAAVGWIVSQLYLVARLLWQTAGTM